MAGGLVGASEIIVGTKGHMDGVVGLFILQENTPEPGGIVGTDAQLTEGGIGLALS